MATINKEWLHHNFQAPENLEVARIKFIQDFRIGDQVAINKPGNYGVYGRIEGGLIFSPSFKVPEEHSGWVKKIFSLKESKSIGPQWYNVTVRMQSPPGAANNLGYFPFWEIFHRS